MDVILKLILINRPYTILVLMVMILLDSNLPPILRNTLRPSNMPQPRATLISLRNSPFLRRLVDCGFSSARSIVPFPGVAPTLLAFVLVGEFDLVYVVEAPGYEARAFAF